jgi:hypothetical protein
LLDTWGSFFENNRGGSLLTLISFPLIGPQF